MRYRGAPRLRRVAPSDGGLGGPRFHPSVYEPGEVSRACEAPAVALRRDDQAVNADLPENLPDRSRIAQAQAHERAEWGCRVIDAVRAYPGTTIESKPSA